MAPPLPNEPSSHEHFCLCEQGQPLAAGSDRYLQHRANQAGGSHSRDRQRQLTGATLLPEM